MTPEDRARTITYLDHAEGRTGVPTLDDAGIGALLERARRIAVIGASDDPRRPSHDVFRHLLASGLECVPVNPNVTAVAGVPAYATLGEAVADRGPVDIVDVFRRPDAIPGHVEDILAMQPRPKVVWFQLGIRNDDAAKILEAAGITVVQNRCTLADHQRLGLGAPARK
jgi:predicted CoA-binding protein